MFRDLPANRALGVCLVLLAPCLKHDISPESRPRLPEIVADFLGPGLDGLGEAVRSLSLLLCANVMVPSDMLVIG